MLITSRSLRVKKKTVKVKETVMPHRWESIKYQRVDNENWPQLGVSNLTF